MCAVCAPTWYLATGANTATAGIMHEKTKELGGYGQYAAALETQLGVVPSVMSDVVAGEQRDIL